MRMWNAASGADEWLVSTMLSARWCHRWDERVLYSMYRIEQAVFYPIQLSYTGLKWLVERVYTVLYSMYRIVLPYTYV